MKVFILLVAFFMFSCSSENVSKEEMDDLLSDKDKVIAEKDLELLDQIYKSEQLEKRNIDLIKTLKEAQVLHKEFEEGIISQQKKVISAEKELLAKEKELASIELNTKTLQVEIIRLNEMLANKQKLIENLKDTVELYEQQK